MIEGIFIDRETLARQDISPAEKILICLKRNNPSLSHSDMATLTGLNVRTVGRTFNKKPDKPVSTGGGSAPSEDNLDKKPVVAKDKKSSRIDPDWSPSDELYDWGLSHGLEAERIHAEADKFVDYWLSSSGSKASKRDWDAAFRNWCRNSVQFEKERTARGRSNVWNGAQAAHSEAARPVGHAIYREIDVDPF